MSESFDEFFDDEQELMDAGETLEGANAASAGEPAEESGRDGGSEQASEPEHERERKPAPIARPLRHLLSPPDRLLRFGWSWPLRASRLSWAW